MPDDDPIPTRRLRDLPPVAAPRGGEGGSVEYGARPRRPRIVGFVGWICAGAGYLSFVLKGSQLPVYFMDMKWLNPNWVPLPLNRVQFTASIFLLVAEMLAGLVCIAGGIGALKMRHWARRLLIYYAIAAIVLTLLKAAWQIYAFDFMIDFQLSTTTQPIDRQTYENRSFLILVISTLMQLTWPLIVITLMTRRYVIDAFDRAAGLIVGGGTGAANDWQSPRA